MSKILYIIDGHSHLYSAYYAIRGLTSPTGEPTNAVYGMTSVMLKILREHHPDYLLTVFDPPGKTFRHEIFPDYKANRPPTPDDLIGQIDTIQNVLRTMGITTVCVDNYEADDVIATVTEQAVNNGMQVVICTKDKDMQQLIGPQVKIYDTTKDKFSDEKTLSEEKNIRPDQVIDMLALMGDTADNVPGIPGVGPKTASNLIHNYGSIDKIIELKNQLAPKIKNYLSEPENIEKVKLSQKLITLSKNAPVEFSPEDWTTTIPDSSALEKLFSELGFNRFLERLRLKTPETTTKNINVQFKQVKSIDELKNLVEILSGKEWISVDTETTGTDPLQSELIGVSFAYDGKIGYYIPLQSIDSQHLPAEEALAAIKPLLEDKMVKKVGQNIKFDILVLRHAGINLDGIGFDTMVASYVLDPSRASHSLDNLAEEFLGYHTTKIKELIGSGKGQLTLDQVETEAVADYAAEDAVITYNLYETFSEKLTSSGMRELFETVEMPMVSVLAEMEYRGVAVNTEKLGKLSRQLRNRMVGLTEKIFQRAGHQFNIDSPKQLGQVLFDELKLPVIKKTKTSRSTDVNVLEELSAKDPLPGFVLEYRQLGKLKNTYIDKLPEMVNPETNRIHASFNQTRTATGRLSSSDPNLQNIPIRSEIGKEVRSAFVPAERENNCLLTCDYSQIELRILAHLSEDENLIEAFQQDRDIHSFVASQIFGVDLNLVTSEQRSVAKTVNFGIVYGQTGHGLAGTLGISRREAQTFINEYFARYPRVKEFTKKCVEKAKRDGYVETILGRRRNIPDIESKAPSLRAFAERTAVNTVAQGSAADLIKLAMINIHQQIKKGEIRAEMLIQVHDELVFEVPKTHIEDSASKIVELLSSAMTLKVPLKVDAAWGKNWLEGK